MYYRLVRRCQGHTEKFSEISEERKELLEQIASSVSNILKQKQKHALLYVCTHNSRRSILAQAWSFAAANFYGLEEQLSHHSAGTETTYLHPNAIQALERTGFEIFPEAGKANPDLSFSIGSNQALTSKSKLLDDKMNPKENFTAIMVCSAAESNCPFVPGADQRMALTFEDPKIADGREDMISVYDERCAQIGREILYMYSKIKVN